MTPKELQQYLAFTIENKFPVIVTGEPGIGKSNILEKSVVDAGALLILSHPVVNDPTDYKGFPHDNQDGTADFLPFGDLHKILTAKQKTVFFLDDLGQASETVQAACMQLLLARRINGHMVSEHVVFVAATNRRQDKSGVKGILETLKSRFISIVPLVVDTEDWINWAIDNNMPIELMAFIRYRPDLLLAFTPSKDMGNSPSPRTVSFVGIQQNAGLPINLQFEAFKGSVGEAFAVEYMAFLEMFRQLPSIDDIIANPNKTTIPNEPSVQYAISCALAKKMNSKNIQAICKYLDRMPEEVSVACMRDAESRDHKITQTPGFIAWSSKNAHLFL